jgi:tRNA(Ile)-lysidine synthase
MASYSGQWEKYPIAGEISMNSLQLDLFRKTLIDQGKLDFSNPVLVGVSGGADSLCLLHLLWTLQLPIVVGHFDHQLRAESAQEAQTVKQLAEDWRLPCIIGQEDVLQLAAQEHLSLEESARNARYRFLFNQAQIVKAQAVLVAHTADDQVETVLMHLLRGAGTSGLRGMPYCSLSNPWSQQISLVRPLLATWRVEIETYLQEHGLVPFQDPTNADVRFYRNYLRHHLIPILEKEHPKFRQRLWRMAEIIRADYEVLDHDSEEAWTKSCVEQGEGYVAFNFNGLGELPLGIQRMLLRQGMNQLRPGIRDIDFTTIEDAVQFVKSPTKTHQRDLAVGIHLYLEGNILWLANWEVNLPAGPGVNWPQLGEQEILLLGIPGELDLPNDWKFRAEAISKLEPTQESMLKSVLNNSNTWICWVDANSLQLPLVLRSLRTGDRIQPFGMQGHSQKLSDFMINAKMPRRARKNWPLVLSGNQVAWVPGYRQSEVFRVTDKTGIMVKLTLSRRG